MNRFLAETHIPAYTNGMGRGTVPPTSPEFLNRSRRDALKKIDCIILAGTLLDFRMAFGKTIPADAKIIQLDMDATLIGQNRQTRRRPGRQPRLHLRAAARGDEEPGRAARLHRLARRAAQDRDRGGGRRSRRRSTATRSPVDPQRMCREVRDWLATLDDPIVIGDGGDIVATAAKILPVQREGAWMDPGPLGTLGVGMPFALAAQLAHPGQARRDRVRRRLLRPQRLRVRHRRALQACRSSASSATTPPGAR